MTFRDTYRDEIGILADYINSEPATGRRPGSNHTGKTPAERARDFKDRQAEAGLVQLNAWVPAELRADLVELLEEFARDRELRPVMVTRSTSTNRFRALSRKGRGGDHG